MGTTAIVPSIINVHTLWHIFRLHNVPYLISSAILFYCVLSTLSLTAGEDQSATVFASVFVLVWCGAGVVTVNAALLGGNMYNTSSNLCLV